VATGTERSLSFGGIAEDYDRLRSGPAPAALDWLLPTPRSVVIDLGAGTGLLTRALASRAGHVIAVEPDDRMRAVLASRSPGVEVLAGRGEAIPLPAACADAVLVSSAWHWMDPDQAAPEVARVLRDGGRFGILGTGRDPSTPWLRPDEWFRSQSPAQSGNGADGTDLQPESRQVVLPDPTTFANIESATFRFSRQLSLPDLVDWLMTYSRVITASDDVKVAGRARAAAALAERFPGAEYVEVPMRSRCWRADRVPR
jgi:ubiquinone/menaquinone biosynthesis C-methylase UbiE